MNIIRVSKEFRFEMSHALLNYDGACKNIHGHSYKLVVTIIGEPLNDDKSPKNGMLIDFAEFKNLVKTLITEHFDHAFLVNRQADIHSFYTTKEMFDKMMVLNYQPTCENILFDIVTRLKNGFPENLQIHNIRLYETSSSYAEWFASDNN